MKGKIQGIVAECNTPYKLFGEEERDFRSSWANVSVGGDLPNPMSRLDK